jgi:endonuclease-8
VPEGDTVWLAAKRMHDALAGHVLVRSDFRVPRLATTDLRGRTVVEVVARGKHMLTRFDDGRTLHTHFEMDGSWALYRRGSRWSGGPAHQVRVSLETETMQAVGYRLPVVELLATTREADVVGHLGPDLLGADWDEAEALRRLRSRPDNEIGTALLDQRNLAGIGNLYKTEMLYLSGITPWTRVGDVPDLAAVVGRGRRLLTANRDHWEQTTTGNTRRGQEHWVFERPGKPCRRCGTTVRTARQGEPPQDRICYWCPSCQAGPSPVGESGAAVGGGAASARANSSA